MKYKITIYYGDGERLQTFDVIVEHSNLRKGKDGRWMNHPEVEITRFEEAEG